MQFLSIGLIGGTGRMGQQVIQKIQQFPGFQLAAVFARNSMTISEYTSNLEEVFEKSSVVIDFSSANFINHVLEKTVQYKKPLISGITGLTPEHYTVFEQVSAHIPVVYDANMSLGITLLKKAVSYFTKKLDDSFDRDIIEFHHRYKKDTPSGTSLTLAKQLLQKESLTPQDIHCHPLKKRPKGAVGIATVHAGGILADQQVQFTSDFEQITLSHRCLDRGVYAEGALKAAQWVVDKTPGLYSMDDVLGLSPWVV